MNHDNDAEADTAKRVVASSAKVIPFNRGRLADPRVSLVEKLKTWSDLLRVGAPIAMVIADIREFLAHRKTGVQP